MKNLPAFVRAAQLVGVTTLGLAASAAAFASTELPIHRFDGATTDGGNAVQTVIKVGNVLYGLTKNGGAHGFGALYSMPPAGVQTTLLYSFAGGTDGAYPSGNLTNVGGVLYGTTAAGGTGNNGCSQYYSSCGTVFSYNIATGVEQVLHSFQGGSDGGLPLGSLLNVGGTLYGTTVVGGSLTCSSSFPTCGTVFKYNIINGSENVIYKFQGGTDGSNPANTLIKSGNFLYGTTAYGGGACNVWSYTCGTVFKLNLTSGMETVLHRFTFADGAAPESAMVKIGNTLWGTTWFGGPYNAGVAYAIPITGGAETYTYNFTNGADGGNPVGSLVLFQGALYGTAVDGGATGCRFVYPYTDGCGTIFQINPSSNLPPVTLHTFQGGTDGGNPFTGMTAIGTKLYGTTYGDGNSSGSGTIFRFIP